MAGKTNFNVFTILNINFSPTLFQGFWHFPAHAQYVFKFTNTEKNSCQATLGIMKLFGSDGG